MHDLEPRLCDDREGAASAHPQRAHIFREVYRRLVSHPSDLLDALPFALTLGVPSAYYLFKSRWNAAALDAIFGAGTAARDADIRFDQSPGAKLAQIAAAITFGAAYFWFYLAIVDAPTHDPTFGYWAVVGPLLLFHAGAVGLAAWKLPDMARALFSL